MPGGDIDSFDSFYQKLRSDYPFLSEKHAYRLAGSYGSLALTFLKGCKSLQDLGKYFGADLYEKEIQYLIQHEWARTTEDIIWRRSKLGLILSVDEINRIEEYLKK